MSEFGYQAFTIDLGNDVIAHVDAWGSGPFVIEAAGKSWRFEDSDRFGPLLVNRKGDPLANPSPGTRSPFWRAHRIWRRQGRRIAEDGTACIWDEPSPTLIRFINRRNAIIVENGEEDGALIDITKGCADIPSPRDRPA